MFCVEWLDSWRTCRMVAPVHLAEWRKANDKFNISGGTASKIFRRGRRLWRSPPLKLAPLRAQIQLDRTFGTKSAKNFFGLQLKGDEPWSSLVLGDERFLVIFEMASTWDTIYGLKWGTFCLNNLVTTKVTMNWGCQLQQKKFCNIGPRSSQTPTLSTSWRVSDRIQTLKHFQ